MNTCEPSIVRVFSGKPAGGARLGTAFCIAPGCLITAKHVIEGVQDDIFLQGPAWSGVRRVSEIHPHPKPDIDIAVLRLAEADVKALCLDFATAGPKVGDQLTFAGYSTDDKDLETPSLTIQSYDGEFNLYVCHTFQAKGLSGGPALRDDRIVGVIMARDVERDRAYIIPIGAFQSFVRSILQGGTNALPKARSTDVDYTNDGEELCIDRRWEVSTFLRMVGHNPAVPQRVLVFQVPTSMGKTKLLERYEAICRTRAARGGRLLHARVDFHNRSPLPRDIAFEIVDRLVRNAEVDSREVESVLSPLSDLRRTILSEPGDKANITTKRAQEYLLYGLARDLCDCFRCMTNEWDIVLLFDTFEYLFDKSLTSSTWLLGTFLSEGSQLSRLFLVFSGKYGLNSLAKSSDSVLFRHTLEPMGDWQDCQRLAELKHDLKISPDAAEHIRTVCEGRFQEIDYSLCVFKKFGIVPPPE